MLDIKITKTTSPKAKPTGKLGFGKIFTDHMFLMNYTRGQGLARPPHRAVPRPVPVPRLHGVPLWPGDVRGPEGLQGRRRHHTICSAPT